MHDVAVGLLLLILATLVSFFRGLRLSSHIYTSALRAIAIAPFRTRHSLVVVFIGTVASLYLPSGVLTSHTAEGVTKCAGRFLHLASIPVRANLPPGSCRVFLVAIIYSVVKENVFRFILLFCPLYCK